MIMRAFLTAIASLLITSGAMAIEEPKYEVLEQRDGYEVRRYDPYIVAEVVVDGPYSEAGSKAFRILADYIFGNNSTSTKMEMTAPVESEATAEGVKMEMTAPVISAAVDEGSDRYRYAFVIERRYTMDTVPKPMNDRIRLRVVGPRTVAAHQFSGSWRQANFDKHVNQLREALQRDNVQAVGQPYSARYNAPFVPWFMRRNEVIIEIGT